MPGISYLSLSSVMTDLNLWNVWKRGEILTLGHMSKLTVDRWDWMVLNWSTLFPTFKNMADGDAYLEDALLSLDANVAGYSAGSNINPFKSLAFFEHMSEFLFSVPVDQLNLTEPESTYIALEMQRVSAFTAENFVAMKDFVEGLRDLIFDGIGLGDDLYSSLKGKATSPKIRDLFISDLEEVDGYIDIENYIQGVILYMRTLQERSPNLLAFAADESGIPFQTGYTSYINVPFTGDLEQMAQDYLGSKLRLYELITVNNLKPPYVDRFGDKVRLVETGAGSSVRIMNLYPGRAQIGSVIGLGSVVVPESIRKVQSFIANNDGTVTLQLDGASDLAKLDVSKDAYVRLYKSETLQDFSFVKIPNTVAPRNPQSTEPTTQELKALDEALLDFGVDIALDKVTGDVSPDAGGDLRLSFGLPAVEQAIQTVISTTPGDLPLHPGYGLPSNVGDNSYGGTTASVVADAITSAVLADNRFTSVSVSNIVIGATSASMQINAAIAGSDTTIPFSFSI